ncbi:MAG: helix-turn-helix domain-containing protein [Butyrivibrio sp.]|nr:helix-turn-helix domain-containing protein [Butyrivibrio sp.]
MAVSYKRLFKLLIDKDMKRKDLKEKTGVSYGTLAKMERGENVQMDVLEKICLELKCQLSDIAEIIHDK